MWRLTSVRQPRSLSRVDSPEGTLGHPFITETDARAQPALSLLVLAGAVGRRRVSGLAAELFTMRLSLLWAAAAALAIFLGGVCLTRRGGSYPRATYDNWVRRSGSRSQTRPKPRDESNAPVRS